MEAGFSNIADMTAAFIRSTRRYVPNYDPFEEYFKNLPSWDASMPDYIEQLANFVIAKDRDWFNYHFKKTLVRVVACALTRSEAQEAQNSHQQLAREKQLLINTLSGYDARYLPYKK